MNYFEEGDITDINYHRAMIEMDKIVSPNYLFMFWKATGKYRSRDMPRIEICDPWYEDLTFD